MCVKQENDDELEVAEDEEDLEDESPENVEQIQLLKRELANLEQQTLNAKHEIEQWKRESKMLENMMKRPTLNNEMLSDIASDVMSRRDESVRKIF
jgi:molecular chaperone GrpE (heat shock protein)